MAVSKIKQRGAIVIMTVFFVIILLGFAALALDLGRLYVLRTDMQNAADAASLAGAVELDGQLGARERAVQAATNLLTNEGQFTTSPELLAHLVAYWNSTLSPAESANSPFVFYSWIGAEPDSDTYSCTKSTEEPVLTSEGGPDAGFGKCITTSDEDARYIQVKLDPDLEGLTEEEKQSYGVDFYFLPVLSILGGSPITKGFTKVMAIAGNTDSSICNLPPLMICAPDGGFDSLVDRGQQVILKTQGPSATWLPGDFAFLEPVQCTEEDTDCTAIAQLNKALAAQLAQERELGCTPSIVSPLPGDRQATSYAVNTRMGLFGSYGGVDYSSDEFPAATDIVDYPRDATFTAGRYGHGDWDAATYFTEYHGGVPPYDPDPADPNVHMSRFQAYYWELYGIPGSGSEDDWNDVYHSRWEEDAVTDLDDTPAPPNWPNRPEDPANNIEQCRQAPVGAAWDHPSNRDCLNLTGDPREQPSETPPGTGVDFTEPKRRVWFVAALNCQDYADEINNRKPFTVIFGDGGNGEFVKFFLTEHVKKGPPTEIIAEYLGPASGEEEDDILIHNIVQLYE